MVHITGPDLIIPTLPYRLVGSIKKKKVIDLQRIANLAAILRKTLSYTQISKEFLVRFIDV